MNATEAESALLDALTNTTNSETGLETFDLSGFAEKKPENTKTEYPVLPDPDGEASSQAQSFLLAHDQEEAAKGAKEIARGRLIELARPFHYRWNSRKGEPKNAVSVQSPSGEVLVQFKDAYKKVPKPDKLVAVLGTELVKSHFHQAFEFTIKSDSIPKDKIPLFIQRLKAMAAELGIGDAVRVSSHWAPNPEWTAHRYTALTPDLNLRLEQAIDPEKGFTTIAVTSAKGRKTK